MYVTGHSKAFKVLKNNPDAYKSGMAWLKIIQHEETSWSNLPEVKQFDPKVEFDRPYTIFSLRGDEYRIITYVHYKSRSIEVLAIVNFSQYQQQGVHNLMKLINQIK